MSNVPSKLERVQFAIHIQSTLFPKGLKRNVILIRLLIKSNNLSRVLPHLLSTGKSFVTFRFPFLLSELTLLEELFLAVQHK